MLAVRGWRAEITKIIIQFYSIESYLCCWLEKTKANRVLITAYAEKNRQYREFQVISFTEKLGVISLKKLDKLS